MKVKSNVPLYCLSCFVFLLVLYTPVSVFDLFFEHSPWESVGKAFLFAGFGYAGYCLNLFLKKRHQMKNVFLYSCLSVWALLCIGIFCLLYPNRSKLQVVTYSILILLSIFLGQKKASTEAFQILTQKVFYIESVIFLLSAAIPWLITLNISRTFYPSFAVGFYLVYFCLYAIMRNQSNIDALTVNRHYALSCLPKRIRLYNILLVVLFLGIVLLAIWGLSRSTWIFQGIGNWISTRWNGPNTDLSSFGTETPASSAPSAGDGSSYTGPAFGMALMNFLFTYGFPIIMGIAAVLMIYLIYCNRALFWNMLCSAFHTTASFFRRLTSGKNTSSKPSKNRADDSEYVDQEQLLSMETKQKKEEPRQKYKIWRKEYRQYCHMEDSFEKYRFGYRLARRGLSQNGVPILPSDTPLETVEKMGNLLESTNYSQATEQYDGMYYGGNVFSEGSMNALNQSLEQIRELWKKR